MAASVQLHCCLFTNIVQSVRLAPRVLLYLRLNVRNLATQQICTGGWQWDIGEINQNKLGEKTLKR